MVHKHNIWDSKECSLYLLVYYLIPCRTEGLVAELANEGKDIAH